MKLADTLVDDHVKTSVELKLDGLKVLTSYFAITSKLSPTKEPGDAFASYRESLAAGTNRGKEGDSPDYSEANAAFSEENNLEYPSERFEEYPDGSAFVGDDTANAKVGDKSGRVGKTIDELGELAERLFSNQKGPAVLTDKDE
jgi:hypothetical protein